MDFEIRSAGSEALPAFIALAEEAAAWLWARGIRQWKPGGIRAKEAELLDKLGQGRLVTAITEGETVAGCLLTQLAPPQWRGREAAAAYLERLVVARAHAGRGLAQAIVAASEALVRQDGLDTLRLDCWAGNEVLKTLYRGLGFRDVAEVANEGHRVCLFEKSLGGATSA